MSSTWGYVDFRCISIQEIKVRIQIFDIVRSRAGTKSILQNLYLISGRRVSCRRRTSPEKKSMLMSSTTDGCDSKWHRSIFNDSTANASDELSFRFAFEHFFLFQMSDGTESRVMGMFGDSTFNDICSSRCHPHLLRMRR